MEKLLEVIAQISRRTPKGATPATLLDELGIAHSITLNILHSALEKKFQKVLPFLKRTMTVGEVLKLLDTSQASTPRAPKSLSKSSLILDAPPKNADSSMAGPLPGFSIGVDIEETANLPAIEDIRTDDFYSSHFSENELSYALLKSDPKVHLCGIFCAKEALKKSHPDLLNLRMSEIEINHEQGRPQIRVLLEDLNATFVFSVSISHTAAYSTASVLTLTSALPSRG